MQEQKPVGAQLFEVLTRHPWQSCASPGRWSAGDRLHRQHLWVTYSIKSTGSPRKNIFILLNIALVLGLVAVFVMGRLVDKHRKVVLITVAVVQILVAALLFPLLSTESRVATWMAYSLVFIGVGMAECTRAPAY